MGTGAGDLEHFAPSTDWLHGGPIIARERIAYAQISPYFRASLGAWEAWTDGMVAQGEFSGEAVGYGDTQLIAAMRAYVASKFGEEVPSENI
ncbi:DUF2591 domain-containing protein [Burkholderia arboris]|uniref:DUF2591 domain-containing protein n=1 Tax=Burkholderia arboris TaxID=488730 RepID=A0ABZ3DVY2_9BURK